MFVIDGIDLGLFSFFSYPSFLLPINLFLPIKLSYPSVHFTMGLGVEWDWPPILRRRASPPPRSPFGYRPDGEEDGRAAPNRRREVRDVVRELPELILMRQTICFVSRRGSQRAERLVPLASPGYGVPNRPASPAANCLKGPPYSVNAR